ncbi:Tf2-6, partial [Mucuna pruriens]
MEHPQSNGQAEAAKKVILRGLRKRLEKAKGRWAKELPQVLWSYHTTPHSTTNETPFCLTFGTEAMIPVEIGELSPWTALFESSRNEEELRTNLDMLQEIREIAHVREYAIKVRTARKYDKRIVPCNFKPQDLVFRKITQKVESNKLTPIWEGPFRILEEVGWGAYHLENLDGSKVPHTWNVATLRISNAIFYNETYQRTAEEADLGFYNETHQRTAEKADPGSYNEAHQRTAEKADPRFYNVAYQWMAEKADSGFYNRTHQQTAKKANLGFYNETHRWTTEEVDPGFYNEAHQWMAKKDDSRFYNKTH